MQSRPTLLDLYTEAVEQLAAQTESAKAHSRILPFINELADKWGPPGALITGTERRANVDFAFGAGTHNALVLALCCPEEPENLRDLAGLLRELMSYVGAHSMHETRNEVCREQRYTFNYPMTKPISVVVQIWKGQRHVESLHSRASQPAEAL